MGKGYTPLEIYFTEYKWVAEHWFKKAKKYGEEIITLGIIDLDKIDWNYLIPSKPVKNMSLNYLINLAICNGYGLQIKKIIRVEKE